MDIEIFVHGVPNGQSFWGKEEDRNYFGNFYGQSSSDAVKYLIQTRSSNGQTYCYYNYLIYHNVVGSDGREGSYFGLSIRFDAYCKDFIGIYKILDTVFTAHVQNKILKYQNGNYKYTIADFVSASDIMDKIKEAIWQLLKTTLTNESVCSLRGFTIGGGKLPTGNLYEATTNDVEATVKQYGMIALSPYYPTVREMGMAQQYDSKLQSVKQQYEERYSAEINAKEQTNRSLSESLASLQKEYAKLQEAIAHKDKIIAQKDSAITNLENHIKQIEKTQKAVKNIDLIKAPIIELADILGGQRVRGENIKQKTEHHYSAKGLISLVKLIMLFVVFIVVVLQLFKVSPKESNQLTHLDGCVTQLNEEIEELRNQFASGEQDETTTDPSVNEETVKINVEGYNEGKNQYLQKDKEYVVTVLNSKNPKDGYWHISGGHINGKAQGESIHFVPTVDNEVEITYNNNKNDEYKSRHLKVQN